MEDQSATDYGQLGFPSKWLITKGELGLDHGFGQSYLVTSTKSSEDRSVLDLKPFGSIGKTFGIWLGQLMLPLA